VVFDKDQLGLTPYVNVPRMPDRHQTLLIGEPAKAMVGPFEADKDNVHTVRTMGAMCVPFEFVECLLGKDLTSGEACLVVYRLLEDNDLFWVCCPFVDFLQVASTQLNAGNSRPVTLQDRLGKADYHVRPVVLIQCRTTILYHLLPALDPTNHSCLPDTFT
jgi:hypothetical protein